MKTSVAPQSHTYCAVPTRYTVTRTTSGLPRSVEWYLDNRTWVGRVSDGCYRGERLGAQ